MDPLISSVPSGAWWGEGKLILIFMMESGEKKEVRDSNGEVIIHFTEYEETILERNDLLATKLEVNSMILVKLSHYEVDFEELEKKYNMISHTYRRRKSLESWIVVMKEHYDHC